MALDGSHYSTLEVVHYSPIQGTDTAKQVVPDVGKVAYDSSAGIEVVPKYNLPEYIPNNEVKKPSFWTRGKLVIGGIVGIALLAAILGGVLGGVLGKKSSSSSSSAPSPASTTSTGSSPTSAASSTSQKHSLAAISYIDSSVNATRVYYQDNGGTLMEAATSASTAKWIKSELGVSPMNGSAIAAAVSRPGFTLEISVFYTDSNYLIHDIIYNHSTSTWQPGVISAKGYTILNNGSITAMYNQCRLCANTTIIAFQDSNGFIQTANKTASGWTLSQLDITPVEGTGLALQPFYLANQVDQINLYHQKSTMNLSLASYKDAKNNNGVYGWSTSEQIYSVAAYGTPIAAASSYYNVSTGFELWIELLSLSSRGIQVNTWEGSRNDWAAYETHPSAMSNSTTNPKVYGPVAMTAMGTAYAIVQSTTGNMTIGRWQVSDDYTDWTQIENVDIGSAWN